MSFSEEQVRALVRKVLFRTLGVDGITGAQPAPGESAASNRRSRPSITEADILASDPGGQLQIPPGAMVTPLARDMARERRVELVEGLGPAPSRAGSIGASGIAGHQIVALGADHGGYTLKENLKAYVDELGYSVVDCGTNSPTSVDYPDYAYAVARLVSEGQAWRGIIVDGAGIGSCMAANKVPGVLAAMCYDHATAVNSRAHNNANVLTLGGALLGPNLARQIVKTWLETDFGGDRHERRVSKIVDIEQRFLRG